MVRTEEVKAKIGRIIKEQWADPVIREVSRVPRKCFSLGVHSLIKASTGLLTFPNVQVVGLLGFFVENGLSFGTCIHCVCSCGLRVVSWCMPWSRQAPPYIGSPAQIPRRCSVLPTDSSAYLSLSLGLRSCRPNLQGECP